METKEYGFIVEYDGTMPGRHRYFLRFRQGKAGKWQRLMPEGFASMAEAQARLEAIQIETAAKQ